MKQFKKDYKYRDPNSIYYMLQQSSNQPETKISTILTAIAALVCYAGIVQLFKWV